MILALSLACQPPTAWEDGADVSADLELIADRDDGLRTPQALAFDPEHPGRLWTVNRSDDSVTLVFDAGEPDQTTEHIVDPYALHFMEKVSSISFGQPGTFGTCQDSRNTYNGAARGDLFTGPTLWSADLDIFGKSNPEAVEFLSDTFGMPIDLGSHLDMLHESPDCMGIAWDTGNAYFVFDGYDGAIVRYDFQTDHGVGYDDHSDGIIARYASGEVRRVKGTVSHLARDHDSEFLYIADTGNNRVATLNVREGRRGGNLGVREAGTDHFEMVDVGLETLIEGSKHDLVRPAGLALIDGFLVLTDAGAGTIVIFELDGRHVATLDTGLGPDHLAGITGDTLDDLWFVDAADDRVYRLRAD
jgi:hypothetical protein